MLPHLKIYNNKHTLWKISNLGHSLSLAHLLWGLLVMGFPKMGSSDWRLWPMNSSYIDIFVYFGGKQSFDLATFVVYIPLMRYIYNFSNKIPLPLSPSSLRGAFSGCPSSSSSCLCPCSCPASSCPSRSRPSAFA